ncbi:hypothetical protein GCM10010329_54930 [Streptomyces spiroverticillatus]|uniref:WD40 repeat domain-containing protein n=1 Tax=Streptomyces finlayi TaxID=67296 RepID=A0A919CCP9_9ACTN|nr:PD40 domain-containing protein [Streptomyces finlayi]GHA24597.1 hypothetical protein GCM10010329_54930 [Streptomyces spiroverticillatus]GHD05817.1 hypothetical protein GCM10010334_56880 [Streptomyces finlayi]
MHAATRTALGAALVAALTVLTLPAASASAGPLAPRTEKLSTGPGGAQADKSSGGPVLSADGKTIAFSSDASNLVAGDTPDTEDVFVRRPGSSALVRVSVPGKQASGPRLSSTGRYLTFTARDADFVYTLHLRDLTTGKTVRLDPKLSDAYRADGPAPISADGRYVALDAHPTDATPAGAGDGGRVYLLDRQTGKTVRISEKPNHWQRSCGVAAISDDGTKVVYQDAYANGPVGGDWSDLYVWDRTTGKRVQADTTHNGAPADYESSGALISGDGTKVTFTSLATNLVPGPPTKGYHAFVRDLKTGKLTRIDGLTPTNTTLAQGISRDGKKALINVVGSGYESALYVRDLTTGSSTLASPNIEGKPTGTVGSVLSADASTVVFGADDEAKFVPGDTNGEWDLFVRQLK